MGEGKVMRAFLLLTAALALSACGEGAQDEQAAPSRPAPETGAAAQVAKLDETLRNGVFEKAIHAAGMTCNTVTQSERTEIAKGVAGWKAECADGNAHLIQILPDGTAKVTSRVH